MLHIAKLDRVIVVLPYFVDVLMDGLEIVLYDILWRVDLMHKVRQHLVAPLMEKLLQ